MCAECRIQYDTKKEWGDGGSGGGGDIYVFVEKQILVIFRKRHLDMTTLKALNDFLCSLLSRQGLCLFVWLQ